MVVPGLLPLDFKDLCGAAVDFARDLKKLCTQSVHLAVTNVTLAGEVPGSTYTEARDVILGYHVTAGDKCSIFETYATLDISLMRGSLVRLLFSSQAICGRGATYPVVLLRESMAYLCSLKSIDGMSASFRVFATAPAPPKLFSEFRHDETPFYYRLALQQYDALHAVSSHTPLAARVLRAMYDTTQNESVELYLRRILVDIE